MQCQTLVELITDYLEGALPPGDRDRFERHLAVCPGCTSYLEQMHGVIRATGMLRTDDVVPAAMQQLLDAFHDWRGTQLRPD